MPSHRRRAKRSPTAGLLAIAVLPAVAGLTDAPVGGAAFASGHSQALRIAAGIAAAATVLAAATFRGCRPAASDEPGGLSVPGFPPAILSDQ